MDAHRKMLVSGSKVVANAGEKVHRDTASEAAVRPDKALRPWRETPG